MFLGRWFVCSCAFVGAGWLGLWVYTAGWNSTFGWIVFPSIFAGLIAAFLARIRERERD